MDQVFSCPACGRQTAYQPEEYELRVRFRSGGGMKEARYRLIRCPGCGREQEVPERPGRSGPAPQVPAE
jgi:hypothetical protein